MNSNHPIRAALTAAMFVSGLAAIGQGTSLLQKPAPAFVRSDLAHQSVSLAALRGKVVLLTFWATWCAPCQMEIPHFIAWQKQYGPQGLQIIGVSMDDDDVPVRSLVKKHGLNYPVLMGDEKLGLAYGGVLGLPVTFLIDREGVVRQRFQGETDPAKMEAAMVRLVKDH